MRNTQFISGLFIVIFISIISYNLISSNDEVKKSTAAAIYSRENKKGESQLNKPQLKSEFTNSVASVPLILPIPENLTFCGERVPLEDPDVRERFEKELYITAHRYYQVIFYLKRGPRIFPEFEQLLRQEKAPLDLIYLSTIESDLIPTIRSPKGALGLWQFIPTTARRYRLRVDKYVDERMHTKKATLAAIQYLKDAKKKFGSWTVAAAAYNMGFDRTKNTIKKQKTDNYYKMHLNPETSRYVFRILAAKAIIESPELYGYSIPKNEEYKKEGFRTIKVNKGIRDIASWADQIGTTYYDIKRLNPWIVNTRLPKGNFLIHIPS